VSSFPLTMLRCSQIGHKAPPANHLTKVKWGAESPGTCACETSLQKKASAKKSRGGWCSASNQSNNFGSNAVGGDDAGWRCHVLRQLFLMSKTAKISGVERYLGEFNVFSL